MKQYTENDFLVIRSQIGGCETVAGYLVENLEKIPFADLKERLENLLNLIDLAKTSFIEKVADVEQ